MMRKFKSLLTLYLIIVAPMYFTFTLTMTKNIFMSIFSMFGGGLITLDFALVFDCVKQFIYYPHIVTFAILFMISASLCIILPLKVLTPGTIISVLVFIRLKTNNHITTFKNKITSNIYIVTFVIYNILSSLIVALTTSYDTFNLSTDRGLYYINLVYCYLIGGIGLLNNKYFILEHMIITALISHMLATIICSIYVYVKTKSLSSVLKVNLFLLVTVVALTIGSYVLNTFVLDMQVFA